MEIKIIHKIDELNSIIQNKIMKINSYILIKKNSPRLWELKEINNDN